MARGGLWHHYLARIFASDWTRLGTPSPNQCCGALSSPSSSIWKCLDGKFRGFSADLALSSARGLFRGGRRRHFLGSHFIFKGE